MDYRISRAAVAKLVAYPFLTQDVAAGRSVDAPPWNSPSLATLAVTFLNVAATRQWSVDELGDPTASARMLELNRAEITGLVDAILDPDTGGVLPQVPPGMPPGTRWEWTGAGWILVLPHNIKGEPDPDPQPDWTAEDQVAIGALFLQAAQTPPGARLRDVLLSAGERLIDVGMSRLG